jgi:hypothetical protein
VEQPLQPMVHAWTQQQQHPRVAIAPPQPHYAMPYPYQISQGMAMYPPGAMIPFVYNQPPQGVPMPMPPPHVTYQYAVLPSQTACNKQNRAVPRGGVLTTQLNSNAPDFIPTSKRSDQQSE